MGRINGEMGGYRERKEGRGREGNERKERGVVPHPKLNAGCATALRWYRQLLLILLILLVFKTCQCYHCAVSAVVLKRNVSSVQSVVITRHSMFALL